jgi:hypothetical protein
VPAVALTAGVAVMDRESVSPNDGDPLKDANDWCAAEGHGALPLCSCAASCSASCSSSLCLMFSCANVLL